MTEIERRILENQTEILWTLRHLVERAAPDLIGRAGALDRMRGDLFDAAKRTQTLLDASASTTYGDAVRHAMRSATEAAKAASSSVTSKP